MRLAKVIITGCLFFSSVPAGAQEMTAYEAKSFVVGKTFAFNCFEGSKGSGRILADGSAIGTVALRGMDMEREAAIPAGTLVVEDDQVCALVPGASFKPCFAMIRTGPDSFRGNLAGYENVACEFKHVKGAAELERKIKALRPQRRNTAALNEQKDTE